jgi:hypothetical protein
MAPEAIQANTGAATLSTDPLLSNGFDVLTFDVKSIMSGRA